MPDDKRVAVLGVGMHPWGKWGRNFVEYGLTAAARRPGRRRTLLERRPVRLRGRHHPQRLSRLRRRRHLRRRPSDGPAPGCRAAYAACASGAHGHRRGPGPDPGRPVRRGPRGRGRHHPQGFLRPGRRRTQGRPGLAPFPSARGHQPDLLRPLRPAADGALRRHRGRLRGGEGQERPCTGCPTPTPATARRSPPTRCWPHPWWPTRCACWRSAPPPTGARPWCWRAWTSPVVTPGRAASVTIPAVSTVTPRFPQTVIEMPNFATDSAVAVEAGIGPGVPPLHRPRRLRGGGHRPRGRRRGRGLRPLLRPRARLVRGHRPVQGG